MKYDSIIFDLDGTLWDSTQEIYNSWTKVIATREHLKVPSYTDIMCVMGLSDIKLMQTLFPGISDEDALELFKECTEFENEYLSKHGAKAYEGIYEVLETLANKYELFIVSNCGKGYIEAYMKSMGTEKFIKDFECFGNTREPKNENIKKVVVRNNLKKPVYVGDTVWDMQAAHCARVPFIHAAYGFGEFECECEKIKKPIDLLALV